MKQLWDKGGATDAVMHRLTVGEDLCYDQLLLRWDCIGSAAQAKSLEKIGILTAAETTSLLRALRTLLQQADAGEIHIPAELEDAHTFIETVLTAQLGDAGKKLHTGRSRNDQILLALRLYLRDVALSWQEHLLALGKIIIARYAELAHIPLPGYTHLQPAMPASIGMWLHAFLEGVLDLLQQGTHFCVQIDHSPLGAAAGFGSSLPIDRAFIANLLGFSGPQRSFIDIQNSRGRYEERLLFWGVQIGALWEKFAWDVALYCTHEFGFFSLPDELTTGSSIMPQKKNPDIVELLRARSAKMRGYLAQLQWVVAKLPSNYHRDLQLSKEPLFRGIAEVSNIFASVTLILQGLQVHDEMIERRMQAELYATYEAYRQVHQHVPFRDAYRATAELVKAGKISRHGYEAEWNRIRDEVETCFAQAVSVLTVVEKQLSQQRQKLLRIEETILVLKSS